MTQTDKDMQHFVEFLRAAYRASELKTKRGAVDVFADRLLKAASEATLQQAGEELLRSMNVDLSFVKPDTARHFLGLASGPQAQAYLVLMSDQARLLALIASEKDDDAVLESIEYLTLPDVSGGPAQVYADELQHDINMHVTCLSPLAHGSDQKAGNASLFRRSRVLANDGKVLELPIYSGNAVRGQLRDLLSDHFLRSIGVEVSRSEPQVALWFYYTLYSGGALEDNSASTKAINKILGTSGAIRGEGIRTWRTMLPHLSLLGCALGNRILPGRIQISDLRPICYEWNNGGAQSAKELFTWEFLTRREDLESHEENKSMIATTEVLKTGTRMVGHIDIDGCASPVERGALAVALEELRKRGKLGAENRRGFGSVDISYEGELDSAPYLEFLAREKDNIVEFLRGLGALCCEE